MADLAYGELYATTRDQARLRMVTTYVETRSASETARRWHTSRQVFRKWLRRFQAQGLSGLSDRSHRPHHSSGQTPPHIEKQVLEAWKKTHCGRHRLTLYLRARGLCLSLRTIRHILRRRRPGSSSWIGFSYSLSPYPDLEHTKAGLPACLLATRL